MQPTIAYNPGIFQDMVSQTAELWRGILQANVMYGLPALDLFISLRDDISDDKTSV